jgi:hypothetical protein
MSNRRKSSRRATPVHLVLMIITGCGPTPISQPFEPTSEGRALAQAVCAARQECGCSDSPYISANTCQTTISTIFDTALENGLTFDKECLDTILESTLIQECPVWPPPIDGYFTCTLARGNKTLGESCREYDLGFAFASDCEEGFACVGGSCVGDVTPFVLESGDPCYQDVGCGTFSLYCAEKDNRCHPTGASGQGCDDRLGCELFTYCKGLGSGQSGVCSPQEAPGATCGPMDWVACAIDEDTFYWCSPETSTCVTDLPVICHQTYSL